MGAGNIAAHGNDNIHRRNIGQQLAVLGLLHIHAVKVFHQPHGIGVDLRLCLGTRRKAMKHIPRQLFFQRLGYLAAAGVVHADTENPYCGF